jgi:hypothetical protein
MCFTENQSYLNTLILILGGLYLLPNYRLSFFLFFLAIKDFIQGLIYYNIGKNQSTKFLTTLSWIHISLQPFGMNLFFSHFDKKFKYWNSIFLICILFALYNITTLKKFDIQNDGICEKTDLTHDWCSNETKSYIGKYHLGYKFSTDQYYQYSMCFYFFLMFIPGLFTKARILVLLWALCVLMLILPLYYKIGTGEIAAIWCFLSIIFLLPVALFHKKLSLFIK